MNMRKITSMTMLLSLVVLVVNSVVLYVVPEGRVAYWADWHFLGLSKAQWGDQHITVGVLFLIAGVLHIYYNWNPILAYMKNKARDLKVFTGSFNVALAVTVAFVVGTYFNAPPLSGILHFAEYFKEAGAETYGEPPYGHAELSSLKMFAKKEGIDVQKSLELLKAAGLAYESEKDTLKDIAAKNGKTPQQIYNVILPAKIVEEGGKDVAEVQAFPDSPKSGWGKLKLTDACEMYGLNTEKISHKLAKRNISAEPDLTIKEIAVANNMEPMELFEAIHEIVTAGLH